ncbi:MAG: thiamine pyrophosphate-dependent dehydrogenase E1 component subunit alpha [Acidimicrobiia bacterium]
MSDPVGLDQLLTRYGMMARIRAFELAGRRLQRENRLAGTLHLSVGQEASAAGVCASLRPDDRITTTHRGHGHCLAKGADPGRMFAELLGRAAGYCKGRSGSMHIADTATGNLGANAIVGGGIPIAVGAGLAAATLGQDWVAVTFFGDGAVGEGIVHECLNIASLWSLPVVFVCENNHYAELSPIADVLSVKSIASLAAPYGIPGHLIDGNDVTSVEEAAAAAVGRARRGEGPTLLEVDTYRQSGHFEGDQMKYRTRDEEAVWAARDPLLVAAARLADGGVGDDVLAAIRQAADDEMVAAIEWAETQDPAHEASLLEDVYAAAGGQ